MSLIIRLEVSARHGHYGIVYASQIRVDLILGLVDKNYCMYEQL